MRSTTCTERNGARNKLTKKKRRHVEGAFNIPEALSRIMLYRQLSLYCTHRLVGFSSIFFSFSFSFWRRRIPSSHLFEFFRFLFFISILLYLVAAIIDCYHCLISSTCWPVLFKFPTSYPSQSTYHICEGLRYAGCLARLLYTVYIYFSSLHTSPKSPAPLSEGKNATTATAAAAIPFWITSHYQMAYAIIGLSFEREKKEILFSSSFFCCCCWRTSIFPFRHEAHDFCRLCSQSHWKVGQSSFIFPFPSLLALRMFYRHRDIDLVLPTGCCARFGLLDGLDHLTGTSDDLTGTWK